MLPEHLHPKTYWEERTELLEESVFRLASILATQALPPMAVYAVEEHMKDWNRLLGVLTEQHKLPEEKSSD